MNFDNFTIKAQEAVQKAMEIAQANENQSIETSHLLNGVLMADDNVVPFLLKKMNVSPDVLKMSLDKVIESYPKVAGSQQYLSKEANQALQKALALSQESKDDFVSVEFILAGILSVNDEASRLLKDNGVTEKDLKAAIRQLRKGSPVKSQTAEETYNSLNKYARNLNELARNGKLDPVIGRDE